MIIFCAIVTNLVTTPVLRRVYIYIYPYFGYINDSQYI